MLPFTVVNILCLLLLLQPLPLLVVLLGIYLMYQAFTMKQHGHK
jgi:hypothetical protein